MLSEPEFIEFRERAENAIRRSHKSAIALPCTQDLRQ